MTIFRPNMKKDEGRVSGFFRDEEQMKRGRAISLRKAKATRKALLKCLECGRMCKGPQGLARHRMLHK